ncbi:permease [Paenibacillaceae bacterium WGS1546]|uniref:permease n=1 Tax=Cohnella sp. WGS1546 TaxID=3366810 RepID=UPI00372D3A2F
MTLAWTRLATGAASVVCAVLLVLIAFGGDIALWPTNAEQLQRFKTPFLGLLLEAMPFLLLGVVVSALLQAFVPDDLVRKLAPRHPAAGVLFGSLLGMILPLCECGMIPIVRRLMRKGLPPYIGLIYIAAGPIVNPVVIAATFQALSADPGLAYARFGLALCVSAALGFILYFRLKNNPLRDLATGRSAVEGGGSQAVLASPHAAGRSGRGAVDAALRKLGQAQAHIAEEFFEMGKYLILGSFIAASLHAIVPPAAFQAVAGAEWTAHLFMMGFAYALSLCSTSDAFVAASFASLAPPSALLSFLVFGPMIDLKNTWMMLAVFRRSFVLKFALLIAALVLAGSVLFGRLGIV